MTREEEIRQKAISEQRSLMESCDWRAGFIAGAKWDDKTMIDKACKWLTKHLYDYDRVEGYEVFRDVKSFVNDFRKAMEE